MNYQYDQENQIQHYTGSRNKHDVKEKSLWAKFLKTILPWVTRKWELGNAYLEAKVAKEANEAEKIKAETILLNIKAQKQVQEIVERVTKEDELNAMTFSGKNNPSKEEIESILTDFQDMLRMMYLKYNLKVSVTIENEDVVSKEPDKDKSQTDESTA